MNWFKSFIASPKGRLLLAWMTPCSVFVLLALLYARTCSDLISVWSGDPNYSHAYLVPLVSLWFCWRAWNESGPPWREHVPQQSVRVGLRLLAVGLVVHAVASFTGFLLLDLGGLVVILRGTLFVLGGRRANRAYGFAALFLIFMAPWPLEWSIGAANHLQWVVSAMSAEALAICGVPVLREGYLLHLPGHSIEVAEACSGLRQLTAFMAMSVAVAGVNRGGTWSNLALLLCSVPVAVVSNCVRIMLTAVILLVAGPKYAEDAFHSLEGTAVAAIGLVTLLACAAGINATERWLRSRQAGPVPLHGLIEDAFPQF